MFTRVQQLVADIVCRCVTVSEGDLRQSINRSSHMFAIIQRGETFDIFQNKVFRPVLVNVVADMPENFSSAFFVVEALLFSCLTEGLAWEASAVEIYTANFGVIPNLDVVINPLRFPVLFYGFANNGIIVTTEFMNKFGLEVFQSLNRGFDA